MSSLLFRNVQQIARRNFSSSIPKRGGGGGGNAAYSDPLGGHPETLGLPGTTIPFNINNKWKNLFVIVLYVSTGLAVPFYTLSIQLKRKSA